MNEALRGKGIHLTAVPSSGLLGHLFQPHSADRTPLHLEGDPLGNVVLVRGLTKSGIAQQLDFGGVWPNEQATFSDDGVPYLFAWTALQELPRFAVGWDFLFSFGVRSLAVEVVYETILPMGSHPPGYVPFVACRSAGGKQESAVRGYYNHSARSFVALSAIDPSARLDSPYAAFSLPSIGKPADLSLDTTFGPELQKASFFGTIVPPPPADVALVPRRLTVRRFLLNMLGACIGAGTLTGIASGAASDNPLLGVALGGLGCVGGALGRGIQDLGQFLDERSPPPTGGGGTHGAAGGQGGGDATPTGGATLPKKKEDE